MDAFSFLVYRHTHRPVTDAYTPSPHFTSHHILPYTHTPTSPPSVSEPTGATSSRNSRRCRDQSNLHLSCRLSTPYPFPCSCAFFKASSCLGFDNPHWFLRWFLRWFIKTFSLLMLQCVLCFALHCLRLLAAFVCCLLALLCSPSSSFNDYYQHFSEGILYCMVTDCYIITCCSHFWLLYCLFVLPFHPAYHNKRRSPMLKRHVQWVIGVHFGHFC